MLNSAKLWQATDAAGPAVDTLITKVFRRGRRLASSISVRAFWLAKRLAVPAAAKSSGLSSNSAGRDGWPSAFQSAPPAKRA